MKSRRGKIKKKVSSLLMIFTMLMTFISINLLGVRTVKAATYTDGSEIDISALEVGDVLMQKVKIKAAADPSNVIIEYYRYSKALDDNLVVEEDKSDDLEPINYGAENGEDDRNYLNNGKTITVDGSNFGVPCDYSKGWRVCALDTDSPEFKIFLYAIPSDKPKYTVTFNVNGHGTAPAAQTDVVSGKTVTKPTDPAEDGYTFGGWYKDVDCTNEWNFETDTVVKNTELYAKWTAKKPIPESDNTEAGSTIPKNGASETSLNNNIYELQKYINIFMDEEKKAIEDGADAVTSVDEATAAGQTTSPKTGDDFNVIAWILMLTLGTAGIAGLSFNRKKVR